MPSSCLARKECNVEESVATERQLCCQRITIKLPVMCDLCEWLKVPSPKKAVHYVYYNFETWGFVCDEHFRQLK